MKHSHEQKILGSGGLFAPRELIITNAKGNYVWTEDRRKLLDMNSGYWYSFLGHKNPKITSAFKKHFDAPTFEYLNEPALQLAAELCKATGYARLAHATSGSDAVDTAVRGALFAAQARHGTKRDAIVSLARSYHGSTFLGLKLAGDYAQMGAPTVYKILPEPGALEDLIRKLHLEDRIAAFVFEPVQGSGGVRPMSEEFLKSASETCKQHDILIVDDEVTAGYTRTGTFLAAQRLPIRPDIISLGKAMSNGDWPLSGALFNERTAETLENSGFYYGFTLAGQPTGCNIGLAVLKEHLRKGFAQSVQSKAKLLLEYLSSVERKVKEIRQSGLMIGIDLGHGTRASTAAEKMHKAGVQILSNGDGTLFCMPPSTIIEREMQFFVKALQSAV